MKCEICNENPAEKAITVVRDGKEKELYVCKACAAKERAKDRSRNLHTRHVQGLPPGVSMSITHIGSDDAGDGGEGDGGGETPPPFVKAIMNAFNGIIDDIEKAREKADAEAEVKPSEFPTERLASAYRIRGAIHLEGMHLAGELQAVQRALHALDMSLVATESDGVKEPAHAFRVQYTCSPARAKRVVAALVEQEQSARSFLLNEQPRIYADSICRALAILKNCRVVSPAEYLDLLSPLRLAAMDKLLEGITLADIERTMSRIKLDCEAALDDLERDEADFRRADLVNRKFFDVMLTEEAEGRMS